MTLRRVRVTVRRADKPYHLHMPIVLKSGRLNLLEHSGPVQAFSGIALNFLDRFSKNINIKFYENPSSGSRVVLCGLTDLTKLTFVFRYVSNDPNEG